jgi:hypothetical protein
MISCEPGEGLTTECGLARRGLPTEQKQKLSGRKLLLTVRLPLTRLAPVALGTLSHKGRATVFVFKRFLAAMGFYLARWR